MTTALNATQQKVSGAPTITELQVIPVAGQDSFELNLSGGHGPYFTRNIVIVKDSAGNTGLGEVPGGEKIRQTIEDARPLIVGKTLGDYNNVLNAMRNTYDGKYLPHIERAMRDEREEVREMAQWVFASVSA